MSKRTWKDMESLHGSTSTVTILNILQELGEDDFKLFKFHLREYKCIPWSHLENADKIDTSFQIKQSYHEKALDITMELLKLINRNDLVERLSLTGPPDVRDVAESSGSSLLTSFSQPPQQDLLVKTQAHAHPIAFYQAWLKTKVEDPFACVPQGTIQMTDKQHFVEYYTRLSVIYVDVTELSSGHEVTLMDLKKAGKEIQLSEMFEHPSGQNIPIRTVLSVGIAGVGKSFLVHKFVFDWAKKNIQHPHLIFVFQFRQLNLLQGQSFCLAQLIHKCIYATKSIPEEALNYIFTTMQMSGISNYDKSPFKLLFILDGLDESSLKLNFSHDCSDDFTQSSLLEDLLVNLIKGKLLRGAHIWITTRPAAAKLIPSSLVDIVTEVQGFTDNMKVQYIRKRFIDKNQAIKIIVHLKTTSNLFAMCEIPIFCSITADVMQDMLKTDEEELPETQTDMYCHFLLVQTRRMKEKYKTEVNTEELKVTYRTVLLKLGRLAFEHLQKGNLIFYQKDLEKCEIDIKEGTLYSGVCTEIFKRDSDCLQETVYCFVHLTIQEFLAAVYLFDCFTERKMEVLETFLDDRSYLQKLLPKFMSQFKLGSMEDFLKKAFLKAQKSENGHLDLFIRFLHGLSLETNRRLLRFLLGRTENSPESIQKTISNLKKMHTADASPDSCISIILCLVEMKDQSVKQEIRKYLSSFKISKKEHLLKSLILLRLSIQLEDILFAMGKKSCKE